MENKTKRIAEDIEYDINYTSSTCAVCRKLWQALDAEVILSQKLEQENQKLRQIIKDADKVFKELNIFVDPDLLTLMRRATDE